MSRSRAFELEFKSGKTRNAKEQKVEIKTEVDDDDPESNICDKVGNFCRYECMKCGHKTQTWDGLRVHLKKNGHGLRTGDSLEIYLTKRAYHRCQVCQELVLADTGQVYHHLHSKHDLTTKDYVSRFGLNTQRVSDEDKFKTFIADIPTYPAQEQISLPVGAIPEKCSTYKIGNLCLVKCPSCPKRFNSWTYMKEHKRNAHGSMKQVYDPELFLEARYHCCVICNKFVLCDKMFIVGHCLNNHRLKLGEYVKMVSLKVGRKDVSFDGTIGKWRTDSKSYVGEQKRKTKCPNMPCKDEPK